MRPVPTEERHFPRLHDDAGEEKRREAVLRLFDRKECKARPPELLLFERAFISRLRECVLLDFQGRRGERDMEEQSAGRR